MKYSTWIGIGAALLLIAACFMPWTYHPDIEKTFTGFFSEKNQYGKPGKLFSFLAVTAMGLFIIPRVWSKRLNMLVNVIVFAFAVKTYMLFTSCYEGFCPEKKPGIFLMMAASFLMLLAAVLPDMKLKDRS